MVDNKLFKISAIMERTIRSVCDGNNAAARRQEFDCDHELEPVTDRRQIWFHLCALRFELRCAWDPRRAVHLRIQPARRASSSSGHWRQSGPALGAQLNYLSNY